MIINFILLIFTLYIIYIIEKVKTIFLPVNLLAKISILLLEVQMLIGIAMLFLSQLVWVELAMAIAILIISIVLVKLILKNNADEIFIAKSIEGHKKMLKALSFELNYIKSAKNKSCPIKLECSKNKNKVCTKYRICNRSYYD